MADLLSFHYLLRLYLVSYLSLCAPPRSADHLLECLSNQNNGDTCRLSRPVQVIHDEIHAFRIGVLALLGLLLIFNQLVSTADAGELGAPEKHYLDYIGSLGKRSVIGLSLDDNEGNQGLKGFYFYKQHLTDIALEGERESKNSIVLREPGQNSGAASNTFHLRYSDQVSKAFFTSRNLHREILIGEWRSADGRKRLPVDLRLIGESRYSENDGRYAVAGAADAGELERSVQSFYRSVITGNRKGTADQTRFPVSVYLEGKPVAVKRDRFLRLYRRIFSPNFARRIAAGIPHRMFANANGIMIANGAVWFDNQGKAFRINNTGQK
jgi:hypothetical protein